MREGKKIEFLILSEQISSSGLSLKNYLAMSRLTLRGGVGPPGENVKRELGDGRDFGPSHKKKLICYSLAISIKFQRSPPVGRKRFLK